MDLSPESVLRFVLIWAVGMLALSGLSARRTRQQLVGMLCRTVFPLLLVGLVMAVVLLVPDRFPQWWDRWWRYVVPLSTVLYGLVLWLPQRGKRLSWAADQRDGEALAKLYEADAVVEVHYRGPEGMEPLGSLAGAAQIAEAMSTAMAPHPPLGWSHHTTYDHLVSINGDEASIETQFITFDVIGIRKPEGGWPAGTFGAQGHHQAHRVRVLRLRLPADRRRVAHPAT